MPSSGGEDDSNSNDDSAKLTDGTLEANRARQQESDADRPTLFTWRQWIEERFNWSWFTCTQSTGGIAILLSECPKQFDGLQTIGTIIFIFNIVLFLLFTTMMLLRWRFNPSVIKTCFTHPPECYFYGSWWLTIATIIIGMERYGTPHSGPWLLTAIRICFWIYFACTLISTTVIFIVMGRSTPQPRVGKNPAVLLTVFQAMLTGTVAAAIGGSQPPSERLPIMVAGVSIQGFGWILSLIYVAFILTAILEQGWPPINARPGMYMMVGTAGYTIVVLIGNARTAPAGYGYFATHPSAAEVLTIVATWTSIFLWLFTFWLFSIASLMLFAEILSRKPTGRLRANITYNNTWWAFIFPNVGFTLATIYLGQELESQAVLWVSAVMVVLLVAVWLLDVVMMAKTVSISLFRDSRVKLS